MKQTKKNRKNGPLTMIRTPNCYETKKLKDWKKNSFEETDFLWLHDCDQCIIIDFYWRALCWLQSFRFEYCVAMNKSFVSPRYCLRVVIRVEYAVLLHSVIRVWFGKEIRGETICLHIVLCSSCVIILYVYNVEVYTENRMTF